MNRDSFNNLNLTALSSDEQQNINGGVGLWAVLGAAGAVVSGVWAIGFVAGAAYALGEHIYNKVNS